MAKQLIPKKDVRRIERLLDELQSKNCIKPEDREVMKLCILLLTHGWKVRDEIRKHVNVDDKTFNEWWNNLKANGYFGRGGKIRIEELDNDVPIYLMSLCAEGFIKRKLG